LLTNYTREQPEPNSKNTTPTRITWATVRGLARANLVSKGWGAPFCYLSGHDGRRERGPGSLQESPREKTHFKAKSIKDVLVSISQLVLNKVILSNCFREVLQLSTQGKTPKKKMKCNTNNASTFSP
jgi:hypothetical protein